MGVGVVSVWGVGSGGCGKNAGDAERAREGGKANPKP